MQRAGAFGGVAVQPGYLDVATNIDSFGSPSVAVKYDDDDDVRNINKSGSIYHFRGNAPEVELRD